MSSQSQSSVSKLHIVVGHVHNKTFTIVTRVASPMYHAPSKQHNEVEGVNEDTGG